MDKQEIITHCWKSNFNLDMTRIALGDSGFIASDLEILEAFIALDEQRKECSNEASGI